MIKNMKRPSVKNFFILCLLPILLMGCASANHTDLRIHQINTLADDADGTGSFKGLEYLASPVKGELKNRVNIFYVHGIGWTENPDGDALANDFLSGIAKAYQIELGDNVVTNYCGQDSDTRNDKHLYITAHNGSAEFETALPGSSLSMDRLVCMDNTILNVNETLEFSIYRVFWDNLFWNGLQFAHVGQDDDSGSSKAIAELRRKYNRQLKDELVNYGFSDAVMYLGQAGSELRRAVQGAMCSAALDASGYRFSRQGYELSHQDACALASWNEININQFAFVTESLGSKITFDVMQDSLRDGKDNVIDKMISGSEFYMLANQLPLLSLNDLSIEKGNAPKLSTPAERPKIIALSELNDFLTYELIPFYRNIYKLTSRQSRAQIYNHELGISEPAPDPTEQETRQAIIKAIGFDIVDMRLEFADTFVPILKGLVDPLQAHGGHAAEPELMLHILCGAKDGRLNDEFCLATEIAQQKDD